jgi:isopentenyl-diphosphate delta-isomerase type 1
MASNVKGGGGEEWFDVVNDRDEVIGRATRREVHATGRWHRAVHVLVFDAAGRVFLQKRSLRKDLCPGLWDSSCSGHLDAGEDYDAAAVRELGEEIGVQAAAAPARWFRIHACAETAWEFVWVYRLRHDGPLTLEPEEIQYGEWVAPAEISARISARPDDFCPSFKLLWPLAARRLQATPESGTQNSSGRGLAAPSSADDHLASGR